MTRRDMERECSRILGLMAEGKATEADQNRYRSLCADLLALFLKRKVA